MKNTVLSLMLLLSTVLLVSCKSGGGDSNKTATVITPTTSTCGVAGYVNTQYGCVPQGNCPANYGNYNGTCYAVTTNTSAPSCLSTDVVNTQIGALTVGVCQPYCATYGKKYGYSNGYCYPAVY